MAETARRIVVIGSGSSGGVAAARLSEDPDNEVLLIEAGADCASDEDLPAHLRDPDSLRDMSAWVQPSTDWGLTFSPTEQQAPVPYPRGKILGGSSAVNCAVAQRGNVEDFDGWAALGNSEWSFEKVLPAFMRIEREPEFVDADYHSDTGPVPIVRRAPENWSPIIQAWRQVCLDKGFPHIVDLNAPGSHGVGPVTRNIVDGMRGSTARTYLRQARHRPNLTIRGNTLATRILFEGTRAVGVEVESDGQHEQIVADVVILSAGAIKSPQLLMLSGVGPRDELEALGIDVVVDLEGVGRHFLDHPAIPVVGLVTNATAEDLDGGVCGAGAILKFHSSDSDVPDLFNTPILMPLTALGDALAGSDAAAALVVGALLGKPESEGWLRLPSNDPSAAPELHLNALSDEAESDIRRLAEAFRQAHDVLQTEPLRGLLSEVLAPDASVMADDEQLYAWIRATSSAGAHAVGTCKMGPADDPRAVVGQDLRVHGTQGLMVADASIMPTITSGMTNLTCFMIGERVAEFLEPAD